MTVSRKSQFQGFAGLTRLDVRKLESDGGVLSRVSAFFGKKPQNRLEADTGENVSDEESYLDSDYQSEAPGSQIEDAKLGGGSPRPPVTDEETTGDSISEISSGTVEVMSGPTPNARWIDL